jgi:hypothetical protein
MNENTLQIYPVLEMSPWRVDGGEDLNLKEGQDYTEFAIEVFKKHGINNIERLDEYGYSSIKMSDINDADLKILVEKELQDAEMVENGIEGISRFCGGIVIINDKEVIHHQCCGGISDYKNWVEFLEESPSEWTEIWIGHPWIYGRISNNIIELSDYIEHTGALKPENLRIKTKIDVSTFKTALDIAVLQIAEIKARILAILLVEMPEIAVEVANLLIENEHA